MIDKIQTLAGNFILLWGRKRAFAAFVCGALSAMALPPLFAFPLLFATLPVFIWLLDGAATEPANNMWQRAWPFFKTGWWFGFGYHLAGLWWVGNAFLVDQDEFLFLLPVAVIFLPAALAIFYGIACMIARLFWGESWRRIFVLAAVLAAAEFARGILFTGFPWNLIGYAAMPVPMAMQTASLIGAYGVTLICLPVFSALAVFTNSERSMAGAKFVIGFAIIITAAHIGYGYSRLSQDEGKTVEGVALRLIQPAVDQKEKWQPEKESEILNRLLTLSTKEVDGKSLSGTTHLIWPESSFPFLLTERRDALASIAAMLPEGTNLITGAARSEAAVSAGARPFTFNSTYVIDSEGLITDASDKVHLVPFGEYLPYQTMLESLGLEQLTRLRGGFEPGNKRKLMSAISGPPFLALICYEVIFPGEIAAGAGKPDWIVNLTNDAWFGNTPGPYQHHHQAIVRGVEEGVPIVRVANTGISSVSDAYGQIVKKLDLGERDVIDSPLPASLPGTLFATFGNMIFFILLLCYFVLGIAGRR